MYRQFLQFVYQVKSVYLILMFFFIFYLDNTPITRFLI